MYKAHEAHIFFFRVGTHALATGPTSPAPSPRCANVSHAVATSEYAVPKLLPFMFYANVGRMCARERQSRLWLSSHLTLTNVPSSLDRATHLQPSIFTFRCRRSSFFFFLCRDVCALGALSFTIPTIAACHNRWWIRLRYGFSLFIVNCIHKNRIN